MGIITIERKVLEKNDEIAVQIRDKFKSNNTFEINIVSSPGTRKVLLIKNKQPEKTFFQGVLC